MSTSMSLYFNIYYSQIEWKTVTCPKHPFKSEVCGYYVMQYIPNIMKFIQATNGSLEDNIKQCFPRGRQPYDNGVLDDMRDDFATALITYVWCIAENIRLSHTGPNSRPSATQTAASSGLDVQIIQTFPTFKYSAVKDLRKGEIELECAICLSEFLDDDFLRLLTVCNHVFHQECVDLWLESHKTCPVCRTALDEFSSTKVSDSENNTPANELHHSHNGSDGSVRISIKENHDEENEIQSAPINTSSVAININEDGIRNARSNVGSFK
ncbi:hypothetical protein QQ045_001426 [Rhodiola kirilowii]